MVQNESHPVPVMVDCQFGDHTKWKISKSGIQKRTVLEMGAITGNGNAISSTRKLRIWVLTYVLRDESPYALGGGAYYFITEVRGNDQIFREM
jgi:hypothetical protein